MVSMHSIQQLAGEIARRFSPEKIILFGSYASGSAMPDSDVDLLVIKTLTRSPFWDSVEILNAVRPSFAVDLLARDPADVATRYRYCDPLIREALDHGKVLYASRN